MKVRLIILLYVLLLPLSACQGQKILHFQGESDNWKVRYQADIQASDREFTSYEIKYIGNGKPPEKIDYKIKGFSGGSAGNNIPLNKGVYKSSGSCSGCAVTRKQDKIKVTIDWEDKTEHLTLIHQ